MGGTALRKLDKKLTGRENRFEYRKPLSEFLGRRAEIVLAEGDGHIDRLYHEAAHLWKKKAGSTDKKLCHFIALFDCSRMNMKNSLITRAGGDACIAAFMDIQAVAARTTFGESRNLGNDLFNIRVSAFSDETATHAGGFGICPHTIEEYNMNLANAKERIFDKREKYTFKVSVGGNGKARELTLNLKAASMIFRHEKMVVASNTKEPLVEEVRHDSPSDMIKDAIGRMESEKPWGESLPEALCFRGGLVDVLDPIETASPEEMNEGVIVQLRYGLGEKYLRHILPILGDGWDGNRAKGLRKCHTAVISDNYAFTGLNGVWGNPFANALTTAGIRGIRNFKAETGIRVAAVPGSHYHYRLDINSAKEFWKNCADKLKECITKTIQAPFFPKFTALEAKGQDSDNMRQAFALESLGMGNLPYDALERADFVINLIENVKNELQEELFNDVGISKGEKESIEAIRNYSVLYRTIRDAQDLAWILRLNGEQELEKAFWGLSLEKGKILKEKLLLKIKEFTY